MGKRILVTRSQAALFLLALLVAASEVRAGEVKVLSANVFESVLDELAGAFERQSGESVHAVYATAGVVRDRVQAGEAVDVAILPRPMMDRLRRDGRVEPASIADIGHSAVGLAVRANTPHPEIGTVDAFRRALLAARSISYADPSQGGATGAFMTKVLDRLGATEEVKSKTQFPPPGHLAVELLARGEVEVALAQPMEALAQPGVELVGLLPQDLQDPASFTFSAAIVAGTKEGVAARLLIQFLSGPSAATVLNAKGMEPG